MKNIIDPNWVEITESLAYIYPLYDKNYNIAAVGWHYSKNFVMLTWLNPLHNQWHARRETSLEDAKRIGLLVLKQAGYIIPTERQLLLL